ncbi:hypothetical protein GOP47_0003332 [Adiantum capillus-veneris]|uniref:Pentatricopeptide repeat-containing protein n=1 Tax=Adiantum capillus-veneris TaxID=13818 RepID=A0A9D4ZPZ4_ADICA|nr:hypothetical protein GOP47_0003332 [Adiantum capillus-veneris]
MLENALSHFDTFFKHGKSSYTPVLRECIRTNSCAPCRLLHAHFIECASHEFDISLWTMLIDVYSKCGAMHDARAVFDRMSCHNVVSWTAMIAAYSRGIDTSDKALVLFQQLLADVSIFPNEVSSVSVLNACANLKNLEAGRLVHAFMIDSGLDTRSFIGHALVNMYNKCDDFEDADRVFRIMHCAEVATWTVLINGHAKQGLLDEACQLFRQMECEGLIPDEVTFAGILVVCTLSTSLHEGRRVHVALVVLGLSSSLILESSLIDMYCKCNSIDDAFRVFNRREKQNIASCNAMVLGCARHGLVEEAFRLYHKMLDYSNHVTFVSILKVCATIGDVERGKGIHMDIIWRGFDINLPVGNALIDFYLNCNRPEDARRVFDRLPDKDIVSWTEMITGCIRSERVNEGNDLFRKMELEGLRPNEITFLSMITACSAIGHLEQGMNIHSKVLKLGFELGSFMANALVDMYSKCGDVCVAYLIFDRLRSQDLVSWNAIVSGYALHGSVVESLMLVGRMQQTDTKPDDVTFLGILSACSRAGIIEVGYFVLSFMVKQQQILPMTDHLVCMVDLLARAGHLEAAEAIIESLPLDMTTVIWKALLNACRVHSCVQLATCVIEHLLSCEREDASALSLLSNIVAAAEGCE